jgi:hypothetical protein
MNRRQVLYQTSDYYLLKKDSCSMEFVGNTDSVFHCRKFNVIKSKVSWFDLFANFVVYCTTLYKLHGFLASNDIMIMNDELARYRKNRPRIKTGTFQKDRNTYHLIGTFIEFSWTVCFFRRFVI